MATGLFIMYFSGVNTFLCIYPPFIIIVFGLEALHLLMSTFYRYFLSGLEALHLLTITQDYLLRVELKRMIGDVDHELGCNEYEWIMVDGPDNDYMLHLGPYMPQNSTTG